MSVIYQFGSTPSVTYQQSNTSKVIYQKPTTSASTFLTPSTAVSTYQTPSIGSVQGAPYTPQPYFIDILLVGGGGGGGYYYGGGGGGGQILQASSILVNYGGTYPITIGTGGAGSQGPDLNGIISPGGNGGSTIFGSYTAIGGGGGASRGQEVNQISGNYFLTQNYNSSGLMYLNTVGNLSAGCVVSVYAGTTTYFAEIISVNTGSHSIQITGIPYFIASGSQVFMYGTDQGGSVGASGGGGCGTDNSIVTSAYGLGSFGNKGGYGTGNYFNSYAQGVGDLGATIAMGGGGGGAGTAGNDGDAQYDNTAGIGGDGLTLTFQGSSYTFSAGGGAGADVLGIGEGNGQSGGAGGGGTGGSGGDGGLAYSGQSNTGSGGGGGGGTVDAVQGLPYPQGADGGSGIALIYSHFSNETIAITASGYFYS